MVPGQVQVCLGFFADSGDLEVVQQFFQAHPVKRIQFGPGQFTGTHLIHERTILGPPTLCEIDPIGGYAIGFAEALAVTGD